MVNIDADSLVMNEINMVSLEGYMQLLTDSADVSGGELEDLILDIMIEKINDPTMGALIDSLMKYGFTVPIELQIVDDPYIGTQYSQGNGHHRLVAAILLGMDRIAIYPRIVENTWDICFAKTTDNENKYFEDDSLSGLGEMASDAWYPILFDTFVQLAEDRDRQLDEY